MRRVRASTSQTPKRRLQRAPVDGRVTREDLERLYREFASQTRRALAYGELESPPTVEEYHRYLVGAILDPPPRRFRASHRRALSRSQRARRARERKESGARLAPLEAAA